MDFHEAAALRDEFMGLATMATESRSQARAVLERGNAVVLGRARPLEISLGISVTERPDKCGIAVRTTAPRALLEMELLPALRQRTDRIDVKILDHLGLRASGHAEAAEEAPLRIGDSVGHRDSLAGTLGAFCRHVETNAVGILSNNHVLAANNNANLDDPILRPGPGDVGGPPRQVAALRARVLLQRLNEVDAAFAVVPPTAIGDPSDVGGQIRLSGGTATPDRSLPVYKFGRVTRFTSGIITAVGLRRITLRYDDRLCSFDDQIEVSSPGRNVFSAGGDSGSIVVTRSGDAVGLLFGGGTTDDGEDVTFVNPIDRVLTLLGLQLLH